MIHIPHRVPHTTEYLGDNYNWGNSIIDINVYMQ